MYTDIIIAISTGKDVAEFLSTSGVKQGDNLAPLLFLFVIMAASELIDKRWDSDEYNLGHLDLLMSTENPCINKRETSRKRQLMIKFYKSFYADDSAFIFTSFEKLVLGSELIVEQFQRVGLCQWREN